MKVTNISRQQKREDRYSVYVDGKYRVSLSENQLLARGLRIGDEVDEAQLQNLQEESEFGKALDRLYNLLSYRQRSRKELVDYLKRKKYEPEVADQLLARLEEQGYVDDAQFATDWVESRQLLQPRSTRHLQAELRQKGIAPEIIEEVLSGVDEEDEVATVIRLIEEKRLRHRYDDDQKLMRYLASKGFAFHTIKAALEQLTDLNSD